MSKLKIYIKTSLGINAYYLPSTSNFITLHEKQLSEFHWFYK